MCFTVRTGTHEIHLILTTVFRPYLYFGPSSFYRRLNSTLDFVIFIYCILFDLLNHLYKFLPYIFFIFPNISIYYGILYYYYFLIFIYNYFLFIGIILLYFKFFTQLQNIYY